MTAKEQYHLFLDEHPEVPIFMQDWWMDAVCVGKEWDVVAGMPCLIRKRLGFKYIVMPQETQIGGLFTPPMGFQEQQTKTAEIQDALQHLHLAYYYQQFPIGSPIPEKLANEGFDIIDKITYRIEDLHNLEEVEKNFSTNKRRQIKKAESLQVLTMLPDEFYAFHAACLREQGKEISYSQEFFRSLSNACQQHNASRIIAIGNDSEHIHAAAFLVHDRHSCYYLIPCYSPQYKDSGAGALLVWESIRYAASLGLAFDFEGSMIPGVANHYRQFGAVPTPYRAVERIYNPLFTFALLINDIRNRKKK